MAHEKFLIGSLTPFGQTMEVTSSQKVPVGNGFLTLLRIRTSPWLKKKFLIGSLTPFGQTMEVTNSQKVPVGNGFLTLLPIRIPPWLRRNS